LPGAEDLIGWHVNGKGWTATLSFYPASRFRERFYRPDVVMLALSLRDEGKAVTEADHLAARKTEPAVVDDMLPAAIELLVEDREITRVEVRIDDRPAAARGVTQDENAFPVDEDLTVRVMLPRRDAVVSLIAYIGDQPGTAATIPVKWLGQTGEARKQDLHALLIGVSQYQNEAMRLGYAAKDAEDLAAKLRSQAGVFYNAVDVELLMDTEATAVDGRLIRKILGSLPGKVILMMDTCRSGAGIEGSVDMGRAAKDMTQENAGIVMFASVQGREDSLETGNGRMAPSRRPCSRSSTTRRSMAMTAGFRFPNSRRPSRCGCPT
jgi:hypothetical protein